jgi:hypothetical protein
MRAGRALRARPALGELPRVATSGLGDVSGGFLELVGHVSARFCAALDGGVLGAGQGVLRDLLAALERVLPGLFDPVDDLIGDLAEVLVLDAGRGKKDAGQEANGARPSGFSFERPTFCAPSPTLAAPCLTSVPSGTAPVTLWTSESAFSTTASFVSVIESLTRVLTSAF